MTDRQWLQARLSTSKGGMGLRGAEDSAAAAYAASYCSSQALVKEQLGLQSNKTVSTLPQHILDTISGLTGEQLTQEEVDALSQKTLTSKIDQDNLDILKEDIN